MKNILLILILGLFSLTTTPVMSHHGRANFSYDDTVSVKGKLTYFRWANPHVYMEVQKTLENNETETWLIEGGTPTALKKMGWEKNSFKLGDKVVVFGNPSKKTENKHLLLDHVIREDGEIFYISSSYRTKGTVKIIPEKSTASQDNLPSKDFSGIWTRGRKNRVTSDYFFPPEQGRWQLSERGEEELARFTDRDNPGYECEERGLPFYTLGPYSFSWKRYEDRIDIVAEYSALPRTIYLNQDTHPDEIELSIVGHSIGHFDEDGSLIVDVIGFPADVKWGIAPGVDSSNQKRIVERYDLVNGGMGLEITMTIEDPVYLKEPITINGAYRKTPDFDLKPHGCDIEAARKDLSFDN